MTEYVLDHNRATEAQIICDGTKESLAESENGHFEEHIEGELNIIFSRFSSLIGGLN